jgi:hypothetical protein
MGAGENGQWRKIFLPVVEKVQLEVGAKEKLAVAGPGRAEGYGIGEG